VPLSERNGQGEDRVLSANACFRQRISVTYRLVDLVARVKCRLNTLQLLLDHSDVKRNELCGPCPNALGADHQFERSLKTCTSGPELLQVALT
jgi:hypothetical protein